MPISSFVISSVVKEAQPLVGMKLDKIHQLGPELFKLTFKGVKEKRELVIELGERINLTDYKFEAPLKPSSFAMLCRKHLTGKALESIKQHAFDRVVTLDFGDRKLIAELFSNGNLILTDPDLTVIFSFRQEEWKDRVIKKGQKYSYPAGVDPRKLTLDQFKKFFEGTSAVRGLASNLRLGGPYAEEVCRMMGVDKGKVKLNDNEFRAIYDAMNDLLSREPDPVMQEGEIRVFPLEGEVEESYASVSEAVDGLYIKKQPIDSAKLLELRHRLKEQEAAVETFLSQAELERQKGDLIYKNYQLIDKMVKLATEKKLDEISQLGGVRKKTKIILDLN